MCRGQELQPNSLRKSTLYFNLEYGALTYVDTLSWFGILLPSALTSLRRIVLITSFLSQDTLAVVEALPFVLV